MVRSAFSGHFSSLPPYVWPAILMAALLLGVLASALILSRGNERRGKRNSGLRQIVQYFEARACAEAFVAIFSGALLWIGFWDVIDSYLVPKQWWAKLCMTLVGALGALATRSLYDQQLIHPHDSEMGTSVVDTGDEVPGSL